MATWHLELLGVANVSGPVQSGVRLPGGLNRVLLGRLALAGRVGCSRELLCDSLWPGGDSVVARHRLRVALLALRRFLQQAGPDVDAVLRADRATIWLDFDRCSLDVAIFESALRQGDWALADSLYAGDLLPDCDDAAIASERERLCLAHRSLLRQLAEASERSGDLHSALYTAERLAALEPLDETVITLLIRLLAQAGHDEAARRRYRKLRRDYGKANDGKPLPRAIRAQIQDHLAETAVTAATAAPSSPAPPPQVLALPPALPATFNRFFGREREMGELRTLLEENQHRLVTATGPGGSGKTRLAIAVGGDLAGEAYFVGLADIGDAQRIGDKIVETLRLPRDLKVSPLEQAIQTLRGASSPLLLLDNLEHLLTQEATREAMRSLLAGAPGLRILATSRQPLEIEGEREFVVAPLPTPPESLAAMTPASLDDYSGVSLFVDRMQAVRPEFRLTTRNAPAVAAVCRQLDGLPLALEIAATWARTLTPAEMLARLGQSEQRKAFLVSRRPRATDAARHASLQAAIDWSYHQLAPDRQQFFTRLHVFRGGCTARAAEVICEEPMALEYLADLQERSLVLGVDSDAGNGTRYVLLETLREYGREQLDEAEQARLARCHAEYFVALAERAEPEMLRPEQEAWGARLRGEIDNFRAVLDAALRPGGDPALGLRLAGALWRFWVLFIHLSEARGYLERLLALAPPDAAMPGQTKALFALGNIAFYQGDGATGLALAEACLRLPHLPEDDWIVAFNQSWLGVMKFFAGRFDEAAADLVQGLALSRAVGDDWLIGYALAHSGFQAFFRGEYGGVLALCEESQTYADRVGEKWLTALNALITGLYYQYERGDANRATALCEQCLAGWRELNDVWCTAFAQSLFAFVRQRQGHTDEAARLHAAGLRSFREMGDKQGIANSLEGLGEAACARDQHEHAVILWAASDALHEQIALPMWPFLRAYRESAIARATAAMGADAFITAGNTGRSLPLERVVEGALAEN